MAKMTADSLKSCNRPELMEKAKELGLKGFQKLRKDDMIALILENSNGASEGAESKKEEGAEESKSSEGADSKKEGDEFEEPEFPEVMQEFSDEDWMLAQLRVEL